MFHCVTTALQLVNLSAPAIFFVPVYCVPHVVASNATLSPPGPRNLADDVMNYLAELSVVLTHPHRVAEAKGGDIC